MPMFDHGGQSGTEGDGRRRNRARTRMLAQQISNYLGGWYGPNTKKPALGQMPIQLAR
jgi:hypothetical protein